MSAPIVPIEEYIGWKSTWMKQVLEFDADNLSTIPNTSVVLSDNGISHIVLDKDTDTIYKRSIPYLIENEIYWLNTMKRFADGMDEHSSYVPGNIKRFDKYTISMNYLGESQPVQDKTKFMMHRGRIGFALAHIRVRHGDLTSANIIVRGDFPYILDWAESRFKNDPRPDKRDDGDSYWLDKTFAELCK